MHRRQFLTNTFLGVPALLLTEAHAEPPNLEAADFNRLLAKAIASNQVSIGRDLRDRQSIELFEYAEKGIGRRPLSTKNISPEAERMIVAFEVTSPERYRNKYTRPIWPHGQSGVTVGIGYDVGYVTNDWLHEDWDKTKLPAAQIKTLELACGLRGAAAQSAMPLVSSVDISLEIAMDQFNRFVLPRYIAETISALPNSEQLSSHSLGALVSLVYNRGAAFLLQTDRYSEMRAIRRHIDDKKFELVPGELRAMKRIWNNQPNMAGLLVRRELEAKLFEIGLRTNT